MGNNREESTSTATSADMLVNNARSGYTSKLRQSCVHCCTRTETKKWKYSLLVSTILLFVPGVVLTIYGAVTSVNLSFDKAFYGGLPAKTGVLVNFTSRGLVWQGVQSRSTCLLLRFISCSEFRENVATNSSCATNSNGMLVHPKKCDPLLASSWIANETSPLVDLYNHQCWFAGGGTTSPFLQTQFESILCSQTYLPDGVTAAPMDIPNQRSMQIVVSISQVVLSSIATVTVAVYLFSKRTSILSNLFIPFLVILSVTIIFTAINGRYVTNLRFLSGTFTECKGLSPKDYAGELGDCKKGQVPNLGSRGTPECVREEKSSKYANDEAALQAAPSAFCMTDIDGNYEDVLIKEFVVAVHCYLAGTVLVLVVTVRPILLSLLTPQRAIYFQPYRVLADT
eukprot:gb/GECG01008793.1/.p1 GENE.gb/GECG01008793.1/~~gb/GECG01008793.1/.p1  ORF type:complete len:398 (+),score=22.42 gb/GECG01008793.1/:1-1194(+)